MKFHTSMSALGVIAYVTTLVSWVFDRNDAFAAAGFAAATFLMASAIYWRIGGKR